MNSKQRLLKALKREKPDRLPFTTHHVMPYFTKKYMNGINGQEFFDYFGMDSITWAVPYQFNEKKGDYHDPEQGEMNFLDGRRIVNEKWYYKIEIIEGQKYPTQKFSIITPEKELSMILQSNEYTTWVKERLLKEKSDIEIIAKYVTHPLYHVESVNQTAEEFGEKGLVRGHIICFDGFGQPGCWQDLACLFGIQPLIMETFTDPSWVHTALKILQDRKAEYIQSLKGAAYDILELGGGDASTTVISPEIFENFVAPYDTELIRLAHEAGQRIVYHTCGGMMPILELIAAMNPDAMETFTPRGMGGDTDLAEAKKRIGDKVCMIGGFDQFHFFNGCTPEETRKEVRRCFEAAGEGGGFIISPSDHFFDGEVELIAAYADEAKKCVY